MPAILITGGTGLVGSAITAALLAKKYEVIILTRSLKDKTEKKGITYALWDPRAGSIDEAALSRADGIVHLAGAGVMDKKWTPEYKQEIIDSRIKSAALLVNTLKKNTHRVRTIISASAIGWYGPDVEPSHFFTEDEPAGNGFLSDVCEAWEQSTVPAETLGIRVCRIRIGIVLSKDGGAYKEFRMPLKFGTAAILGSGRQMISWIHIDDLARAFIFALENESMSGSYNAAAPKPENNKTLTLDIAKAVKGKFYLPVHVPEFILKIMMGARSAEILESKTVSADKLHRAGFTFLFPNLETAVANLEGS